MKPGIFVTVIAAMTFATLLGCSDDGMEQYYKDAQFRGTAWRPSVGENVVSLTEFKTACEILELWTSEQIRRTSGKADLIDMRNLTQIKWMRG